jgi:hypothetical protein
MSMHSEYVARMKTQLQKWDADVDALQAQGKAASEQARTAYEVQVKELKMSREAAQKTFHQMRVASEAAGAQMQAGMEGAWETMQKALEKVSADLSK